ncbi:MAG: DUF6020 family protein [Firmicutes bacterium]|nr:DUF6020 family protein [Bacillota bacterium]
MYTTFRGRKSVLLTEVFFFYCWLVNLVGTECSYSTYVLCAVCGIFCLIANAKRDGSLSNREKVWLFLIASLFSIAVMVGNYALFTPLGSLRTKIRIICSFLGGFFLCWNILIWLLNRAVDPDAAKIVSSPYSPRAVFFASFLAISLVDLVYLFSSAYPGVASADSLSTIGQILSGQYNNTMPFWHTMTFRVFFDAGMALFGNINAAVAFFSCGQILFLSACLAYALATLYQAGVPKPVWIAVFLISALTPYNIVYSVTLWKDVLFGAAALLMVTAMYRILSGLGRKMTVHYVLFSIGCIGLSLWRTNGWYVLLVSTLLMSFFLVKRNPKLLLVMVAVLVISWVLIQPLLAFLHIAKTDLVEAFAVPFQQFARYIAEDGWMDEVERELLSMAFDLEKAKEVYSPYCVDPVKFQAFRRENLAFIEGNLSAYVRLYLQFFERRPDLFLQAWVDETKGFWAGGFPDPVYDLGIVPNDFGLVQTAGGNFISHVFDRLFSILVWTDMFHPLFSIGLAVWGIIACCVVNALKKHSTFLLSIPLIVISVGLWFGTPVVAEFRYGYPMMLTAPFLLAVTLFPNKSKVGSVPPDTP